MTTVFFLRHGPTRENAEERVQGQRPGTLLMPETERYLAAITPLLRGKRIDLLLSSDIERAVITRDVLKQFLQQPELKVSLSPLLREKAMGFYEGMLWRDVPPAFREQRGQDTYNFRLFGGENDVDVANRVRSALQEFARRYPNFRMACVTHAGWISQLSRIADSQGILPNQWENRTAIYEAGLGPVGQLKYFHPLDIEAQVKLDSDE